MQVSPRHGVQSPPTHPLAHAVCNLLIISLCSSSPRNLFSLSYCAYFSCWSFESVSSLSDNITIVLLTYHRFSESFCSLAGRAQRSRRYQVQLSQYLAVWLVFASPIHPGEVEGLGEGRETNRINPLNSLCKILAPRQSSSGTNGQCFSLIALSKITNHNVG